jgi:serine/threonine protein kinase/Tfp pilus assembly protein PilF
MTGTSSALASALADRYTIERELGRGGMATVYLAADLKHRRQIAIKVLKPELAAALGAERFLREIEVTAGLAHPHILPLHDSGEADGFLYYVMPYVAGESLRQWLERETQLPVEEALRITQQVASALDFAHRQDVVHRDIKPENVLLHEGVAMVADFGIALAVSAAGGERLTATGISVGTVEYMSPEQAMGEDLDARSDIYSLGCVLYEMLVGEPPYTGPTAMAVLAKRLSDPVPSARRLREAVPGSVDAGLVRALARERVDRFGSAREFAEALLATEEDEEVAALESIVVLPFENLSPDPENEYFADGLTEELIAELSGIGDLRVISRTTALKLKGTQESVPEIGRELNVHYVLEGSVRKAGNALRITAQLIDAVTDAHIWADRYSGTMEDVFEIQERLARTIVEQLKVTLRPEEERRIAKRPISDPVAYECYVRAKHEMAKWTQDALDKGVELLEKSLAMQGPNELLFATLGIAHTRYFILGIRSEEVLLERAAEWAAKAFELNPESAGGHVVRGLVLWHQGRIQEAVRDFKAALRSDPQNADAIQWLACSAGVSGHLDTARSYYKRLVAVDPWGGMNPGWVEYYDGCFEASVEGYRKEYEMDPNSPYARWAYGNVAVWAGRIDEGSEILDKVVRDYPETTFGRFSAFLTSALRGKRDEALRAMIPELKEAAWQDIQLSWLVAAVFSILGMKDEALDWLEQAVRRGFVNYPFLTQQEPYLESVRGEPRFRSLMEEVKRRWEAFEP